MTPRSQKRDLGHPPTLSRVLPQPVCSNKKGLPEGRPFHQLKRYWLTVVAPADSVLDTGSTAAFSAK
jgi:hypothetical protein